MVVRLGDDNNKRKLDTDKGRAPSRSYWRMHRLWTLHMFYVVQQHPPGQMGPSLYHPFYRYGWYRLPDLKVAVLSRNVPSRIVVVCIPGGRMLGIKSSQTRLFE